MMTSLFRRHSRGNHGDLAAHSDSPVPAELNNSNPGGGGGGRTVRRLEFNQAMDDFRTMFPSMEQEVIECVLRANHGAVDSTIDQLLQMSLEGHGSDDSSDSEDSIPPEILERTLEPDSSDEEPPPVYSPPSYDMHIYDRKYPDEVLPTASPPPSFDSSQSRPCLPPPGPPPPASQRQVGSYRNWNPPLLGNLPDDFLRILPQQLDSLPRSHSSLTQTSLTQPSCSHSSLTQTSLTQPSCSHSSLTQTSLTQPSCSHSSLTQTSLTQPSCSHSSLTQISLTQPSCSHSSLTQTSLTQPSCSHSSLTQTSLTQPSCSHSSLTQTSLTQPSCSHSSLTQTSLTQPSCSHSSLTQTSLTQPSCSHSSLTQTSLTQPSCSHSSLNQTSLTQPSCSSSLLSMMQQVEPGAGAGAVARAGQVGMETDQERKLKQYLEDERIALFLQNEEFMRELQRNREFLIALERDRLQYESKSHHSPAFMGMSTPGDNCASGSGEACTNVTDDALFRDKLKHMGKSTRKKLFEIARAFSEKTRRRKRKRRALLKHNSLCNAVSTANLLEDEEAGHLSEEDSMLKRPGPQEEEVPQQEVLSW